VVDQSSFPFPDNRQIEKAIEDGKEVMRNAEEELADFNTRMTAARLDVAGNTYQDTGVDVHKEAIDLVARADALEKGLEKLYPEPKKLLAELQEQAAKVIPIMERVKSRKVMLEGAARIPVSVMKQMARVLPAAIQFLESSDDPNTKRPWNSSARQ
jgi:predicted  nucleic acid-binding Zn-ribbon protein